MAHRALVKRCRPAPLPAGRLVASAARGSGGALPAVGHRRRAAGRRRRATRSTPSTARWRRPSRPGLRDLGGLGFSTFGVVVAAGCAVALVFAEVLPSLRRLRAVAAAVDFPACRRLRRFAVAFAGFAVVFAGLAVAFAGLATAFAVEFGALAVGFAASEALTLAAFGVDSRLGRLPLAAFGAFVVATGAVSSAGFVHGDRGRDRWRGAGRLRCPGGLLRRLGLHRGGLGRRLGRRGRLVIDRPSASAAHLSPATSAAAAGAPPPGRAGRPPRTGGSTRRRPRSAIRRGRASAPDVQVAAPTDGRSQALALAADDDRQRPTRSLWRAVSGASPSAPATRTPRMWRSLRAPG